MKKTANVNIKKQLQHLQSSFIKNYSRFRCRAERGNWTVTSERGEQLVSTKAAIQLKYELAKCLNFEGTLKI
jgi:hypothetical protein